MSFYDDPEELTIRVQYGAWSNKRIVSLRRLNVGLVHLIDGSFVDRHGTTCFTTLCGMRPKSAGMYGPKINIDEESVPWRSFCQKCAGQLVAELESRKNDGEQRTEKVEEMKMEQPVIVRNEPPPKVGRHISAGVQAMLKELIDAAIDSPGEWVSVETERASVSTVYREFARGRIEALHRKGSLYVRTLEEDG